MQQAPKPQRQHVRPNAAAFVLTVLEGAAAGAAITLDSSSARAVLGSGAGCTLELADSDVTRCHASVHLEDGRLVLIDVGCTGRVSVNGVTVKEAFLSGGEIIRIGATIVEVRRRGDVLASGFGALIGRSAAMRDVAMSLAALAPLDSPLLLAGEAGTGKALAAREVHRVGRRASSPFVELSRSDVVADSVQTALASASDGVLFIDEVCSLKPSAQAEVRAALSRPGAARLIAATRRDLGREVALGRFDPVLALVLAGGRVLMPPLRDRDADVAYLARVFWREGVSGAGEGDLGELPSDFLPRFDGYRWPGNVRELKAAVLARRTLGEVFASRRRRARDDDDFLESVVDDELSFSEARVRVVREFESRYVVRALSRHVTKARAAAASGIGRRHFDIIRARSGGAGAR